MTLTYRDIAEILKAIDESQAEEIEIEVEGLRLAVRKKGASSQSFAHQVPAVSETDSSDSRQATTLEARPVVSEPVAMDDTQAPPGHEIIRSPMVGTFYSRPNPEADPFVEPGTTVAEGDPLCLIEVMKLYTTVESTTSGTVVSIFAEDGKLVEFDQQLYLVKIDN